MSLENSPIVLPSNQSNLAKMVREHDWASTPLGAMDLWPQPLRSAVSLMLNAWAFPMFVAWGPDLHTIYNDGYTQILGGKHPWALGKPFWEIWKEIRSDLQPFLAKVMAGETFYMENMPLRTLRNGYEEQGWFTFSWSPVLAETGTIAGIYCACTETTRMMQAEQHIKEGEERYRLSLEASGMIGTWTIDPETNIAMLDDQFSELFEIDPATASKGVNTEVLVEKLHPEDRPRMFAAIAHAIETGERYDIDYRICQQSGAEIWVNVKGKMFTDIDTRKKQFAGVAVDITDRKLAEQKLIEANHRKDEFLAMLAHELRNPLAPISAAAELLQTVKLDEHRVRQTSEIIVRQIDHMTGLVNDLLDVSRVTRGLATLDKAPVDIRQVITEAIEQATSLIQSRHHHLMMNLAPDATIVSGDRKRLIQVVANVVHNAAKYTRAGGNIMLKTEVQDEHVQIEVSDNGIGMTPDLASRVFELFSQARVTPDRTSGGLGLGLALVKSLVELHGGTVTCASAGLGHGSTFTICLPRLPARTYAKSAENTDFSLQQNAKALRIMVVDDNIDAAAMLAMLLEAAGHQVVVEHGARRALERAKAEPPQVFLLDIGLPEIDGNELAQRLRTQPETAKAVLIAVTGYGQDNDRERTLAAGFDHHLVKPVDTAKLAAILAEVASV